MGMKDNYIEACPRGHHCSLPLPDHRGRNGISEKLKVKRKLIIPLSPLVKSVRLETEGERGF